MPQNGTPQIKTIDITITKTTKNEIQNINNSNYNENYKANLIMKKYRADIIRQVNKSEKTRLSINNTSGNIDFNKKIAYIANSKGEAIYKIKIVRV